MDKLDPGPFDIWKVERHDQPDFWKAIAAVLLCLGLLLHSCLSEAAEVQPGIAFVCTETHRTMGLRSNDPEVLLGAVLVYLKKVEPEIFLKMIHGKDERKIATHWLKACLGIELKDET